MPIQQNFVDQIDQGISIFLFNNKVERIKLEQLYTKKEKGSLELVNIQAKCQALIAKNVHNSLEVGDQHLRYWISVNVRGPRANVPTCHFKTLGDLGKEVYQIKTQTNKATTSKLLYKEFTNTPPPSKIKEIGILPVTTVCTRKHSICNNGMLEFYFQMIINTLPTKARLHNLNPRRWEEMLSP